MSQLHCFNVEIVLIFYDVKFLSHLYGKFIILENIDYKLHLF